MIKEDIYLSIGANILEPLKNIRQAIDMIQASRSLKVQAISRFYKTSPVEYLHQPDFINCVVWMKSSLNIHIIHKRLQKFEKQIGRIKSIPKGPRKIDIDIILYGTHVILTSELEIPHPRMHKRKFVLLPLSEINKDLSHPELGQTVESLLNDLPPNPVETVELIRTT